jgi:hypothetical protein
MRLWAVLLLLCAGCATTATLPVRQTAPVIQAPASTRVLGQAERYFSASGERLEVVHDGGTGVAIVKLPDEQLVILPAELAGTEGRYRDDHLTLWETDGGALLWRDGTLVFTGSAAK